MKFTIIIMIFFFTYCGSSFAEENYSDLYFSNQQVLLTPQEKEAFKIVKKWQDANNNGIKPFSGADGSIVFPFGTQHISIVCAILQVCDVSLQPGEQVNNINLGDSTRWTIEPSISGTGTNEVQHLIIKTRDVGLNTSLVVTTDRRTYRLQLRSHRTKFMPSVSFSYPGEAMEQWDAIKTRQTEERKIQTIPETNEYLGDLNFNYEIEGDTIWKPVRVYNDSQKSIIQMPESMSQTEAPTLLVVTKEDGMFSDEKTLLVNYRVQNNRYIVDYIFDKAILIVGVGSDQERITITRGIN
jgi:type IV secretion system protein TrbG